MLINQGFQPFLGCNSNFFSICAHACACAGGRARARYVCIIIIFLLHLSLSGAKTIVIPTKKGVTNGCYTPVTPVTPPLCKFMRFFARLLHASCFPLLMRLPRSVAQIAEIIGTPLALRLETIAKPDHRSTRRRGYKVRIPLNPIDEDHPLVGAIGREGAEKLRRHFGGETMPFPVRSVRSIRRAVEIARGYTGGASIDELAQLHGVSVSTVARALEKITHRDLADTTPTPPPGLGSFPRGGCG
jgi:hypothetical protein